MTPDCELLRRFAETHSEEAFTELVRRHLNLVYSAALRQANGDALLAQDVAQIVFTDLARKARAVGSRESLTGWLYTSTRFASLKAVRSEHRRNLREQEAQTMHQLLHDSTPEPDWRSLSPVLDEVMHQLMEKDREALLLRYFENLPFAEIGARCGLNENSARMRVERALEKLRALLAKRGLATAAAALASVISAHAMQAASLAATITTTSVACAGTGTYSVWTLMNMTKLKIAASALVVIGGSTALILEHQAQQRASTENQILAEQVARLKSENESLSNIIAETKRSVSLSDDQFRELLRLRGVVGALQQQTNEISKLRQENRKLLAEKTAQADPFSLLSAEDQYVLRQSHISDAMDTLMNAVKAYATNHNGQLPSGFDELTDSGHLKTNCFAGNLTLSDFEFLKEGTTNWHGSKLIFCNRIPNPRPSRQATMTFAASDERGIHFETVSVADYAH